MRLGRVVGAGAPNIAEPCLKPSWSNNFGLQMPFDLTILRVGALAAVPMPMDGGGPGKSCDKRIIAEFRKHAETLVSLDPYLSTQAVTERVLNARYLGGTGRNGSLEPIVVTTMPDGQEWRKPAPGQTPPVVALLPALRFEFKLSGMEWILRTRASVTACAVQQSHGVTKLWWTYEAIPKIPDPDIRPSQQQVATFFAEANRVEHESMPLLHKAYGGALVPNPKGPFELRGDRIRISLADNDDSTIAAFADALYFDLKSVDEIRYLPSVHPARMGLVQFETFIAKVTGFSGPLPDGSVSVADDVEGTRGILFRHETAHQTVVAGLARPAGPSADLEFMSPSQRRKEKAEEYLRDISSARPISAWVAGEEARKVQGRTPVPELA
jgi:hypothetical protein